MIKNISRDYEVSIWTLQDSFIAILKQSNLENKGTIQDPQITLKDDGDNTFSFKIPMYIRENTGVTEPFFKDGNVWRENPIWYTVRNGNLIANLRKIKVIFDKGGENEKVFEYIINNVKEEHEGYSKYCEVECGGLAFHELGKQGYEIELSQAIYDKDVQDWKENPTDTMPINNINYWIEKVLAGSNWDYDINMDWSLYDGIIGPRANGVRQRTKVYDQPYISNWILNETNSELVAKSTVTDIDKLEKRRIVEKSQSNRYNLLMTIAETFQVFCRFEYEHDDNYHITNRKVIFYNNFVKEAERYVDLNYGYNVSKITREMDSTDLISKMYVSTLTGTGTLTNEVNLKDVDANLSLENYLFNFEYLYKIGTISQEQYEAVRELEVKLRGKNIKYIENSKKLSQLKSEKIDLKAKIKFADDVIEQANLNINDASDISSKLESISEYTPTNPLSRAVIHNYANPLLPYITIPRQLGGIIASGLTIYTEVDSNGTVKTDKKLANFIIDRDEYNFIKQINFPVTEETEIPTYLYLVCKFEPKTPAKIIQEIWQGKRSQAEQDKTAAETRLGKEDELKIEGPNNTTVYQDIDQLTKKNDTILEEKRKLIESFERLMGPAIREGTWQPEDSYANYHTDENFTITLENNSTDSEAAVGFIWDTELFDGELNNSYKFGVTDTRFYPAIFLDGDINISDLNNLNFIYQDIYLDGEDNENKIKNNHFFYYGADNGCKFAFLKDSEENVHPALLLLGSDTMDELIINNTSYSILDQLRKNARLSNISYNKDSFSEKTIIAEPKTIDNEHPSIVQETTNYKIVYPRFFINSDKYITTLPETKIYYDGEALKEFTDYKAPQYRDGKFYLTLNIDLSNYKNSLENYKFNYFRSSAGEAMYLDAVEVLRENSVPKVSYTVEPAALDKNFMLTAYNRLGQLAHINDQELKFENVRGYFSEMNLNLDKPWEDNYTIKNYKTKFEDLFSTIVAQTEAMQKNSQLFSAVSNAFNTGGWLTDAMINNINERLDINIPIHIPTPGEIYAHYEPEIRSMLTSSFNEAGEVLAAAQSSVNDVNNLNITNAGILANFVNELKDSLEKAAIDINREKGYINIYASNSVSKETSLLKIDNEQGIYIGSNKSITFYSGPVGATDSGASAKISPERILFGVTDGLKGNVVDVTKDYVLLGSAKIDTKTGIPSDENVNSTGLETGAAGVKITQEYIRMATGDYNTDSSKNTRNYISMDSNGIELANSKNKSNGAIVKIDQNGVLIGTAPSAGSISSHITNIKNGSDTMTNYHGAKFQVYAPNFVVDADGYLYADNAYIAGTIRSTSGYIGGWTIETNRLKSGSGGSYVEINAGASTATNGSEYAIWAGNSTASSAPFSVTKAGKLTATGADITGAIKAKEGNIGIKSDGTGGWVIGENNIHSNNGPTSLNATTAGLYLGTDGIRGNKTNDTSTYFKLTNGTLTATNVDLSGKITASTGTIGGITANSSYGLYTNSKTAANSTQPGFLFSKDGAIYLGAYNSISKACPFQVTSDGKLTATGATINGNTSITAANVNITGTGNSAFTVNMANFKVASNGDVTVKGAITATSGTIGNCKIEGGNLKVDSAHITSIDAEKITSGTLSGRTIVGGTISLGLENIHSRVIIDEDGTLKVYPGYTAHDDGSRSAYNSGLHIIKNNFSSAFYKDIRFYNQAIDPDPSRPRAAIGYYHEYKTSDYSSGEEGLYLTGYANAGQLRGIRLMGDDSIYCDGTFIVNGHRLYFSSGDHPSFVKGESDIYHFQAVSTPNKNNWTEVKIYVKTRE